MQRIKDSGKAFLFFIQHFICSQQPAAGNRWYHHPKHIRPVAS